MKLLTHAHFPPFSYRSLCFFHLSLAPFGSPPNPHESQHHDSHHQDHHGTGRNAAGGYGGSGVGPMDSAGPTYPCDAPISDNSVSTTSIGHQDGTANGATGWGSPYQIKSEIEDSYVVQPYSEFSIEESVGVEAYGGMDGGSGGGPLGVGVRFADPLQRPFRSKGGFKSNLLSLKSGLKNVASSWIPNIFNKSPTSQLPPGVMKTSPGRGKGKNKSKLVREDSLNSQHSTSFYSSGLGSQSESHFSSSYGSTSKHLQNSVSQGYVSQVSQASYGTPSVSSKAPVQGQAQSLATPPQANYDQRNNVPAGAPVSSRRSSLSASVSNTSLATTTTSNSRQAPKHLNQTENLVIQPQSLAIVTEQYPCATPQPPTQPGSSMDIILPDEMVKVLHSSFFALFLNHFFLFCLHFRFNI